MSRPRKYPEELVDRGIRLVFQSGPSVAHVAAELGLPSETLRNKVRQAEVDEDRRQGLSRLSGGGPRLGKENAEFVSHAERADERRQLGGRSGNAQALAAPLFAGARTARACSPPDSVERVAADSV